MSPPKGCVRLPEIVMDSRVAPRRRILKAAVISLRQGGTMTCSVRNISKTGAALGVASPVGIPDFFNLVLEMESLKRPCQVVWRKEASIGVRFI